MVCSQRGCADRRGRGLGGERGRRQAWRQGGLSRPLPPGRSAHWCASVAARPAAGRLAHPLLRPSPLHLPHSTSPLPTGRRERMGVLAASCSAGHRRARASPESCAWRPAARARCRRRRWGCGGRGGGGERRVVGLERTRDRRVRGRLQGRARGKSAHFPNTAPPAPPAPPAPRSACWILLSLQPHLFSPLSPVSSRSPVSSSFSDFSSFSCFSRFSSRVPPVAQPPPQNRNAARLKLNDSHPALAARAAGAEPLPGALVRGARAAAGGRARRFHPAARRRRRRPDQSAERARGRADRGRGDRGGRGGVRPRPPVAQRTAGASSLRNRAAARSQPGLGHRQHCFRLRSKVFQAEIKSLSGSDQKSFRLRSKVFQAQIKLCFMRK
eukprot:SAG11_NODE_490_length_8982_cov_5.961162_3_plen_384_part_00